MFKNRDFAHLRTHTQYRFIASLGGRGLVIVGDSCPFNWTHVFDLVQSQIFGCLLDTQNISLVAQMPWGRQVKLMHLAGGLLLLCF